MDRIKLAIALIISIAFCACKSDDAEPAGIDHAELAALLKSANLQFSKVRVSCKVVTPERTDTLPPFVIHRGGSNVARSNRQRRQPTDFKFPIVRHSGEGFGSYPITPAAPSKFANREYGWTLELGATSRDGFMVLSGTLTGRRAGDQVRADGEPFRPVTTEARNWLRREVTVILSENAATQPSLVSEEFPILIAAKGSGTYRVYLDEEGDRFAEFRFTTE